MAQEDAVDIEVARNVAVAVGVSGHNLQVSAEAAGICTTGVSQVEIKSSMAATYQRAYLALSSGLALSDSISNGNLVMTLSNVGQGSWGLTVCSGALVGSYACLDRLAVFSKLLEKLFRS